MATIDTGSQCDFQDPEPIRCKKSATWKFKLWNLCDFHAGFITSVDYFNEYGKPKKIPVCSPRS